MDMIPTAPLEPSSICCPRDGEPRGYSLFAWMARQKLTNWAGNLTYSTDRLEEAGQLSRFVPS